MVPSGSHGSISPGYAYIELPMVVFKIKNISPEIATHKKSVFVGKAIIEFGIEIIEIIS
jgi:hypothetical protein